MKINGMVTSQSKEFEKTDRLDKDLQELKGQMGKQQKEIETLISSNQGMTSTAEVKAGEKIQALELRINKLDLGQKQAVEQLKVA